MATISFLFGSGFSIPEGLPGVRQLNQRMGKIDEGEILIHSDQHAMFLSGQEDPNRWSRWDERQFLQEFLEFYNNDVLKDDEEFHYETFYDFYSGYLREGKNKELIEGFYQEFNARHFKGKEGQRDCYDRVSDFNRSFNQLLGSQLHRLKYFEDVSTLNYPPYDSFLGLLRELLKDNHLKIHTLNHDLFFDWLGRHHADLWQEFSDGFELVGSPFYGSVSYDFTNGNQKVHKTYKVKLERFTDKFDTQLCLFKLHGSVFNTIVYRQNNERIRIKSNYAVSDYYEEVLNDDTKKFEFQHLWDQVSPDFLSGTTEKTKRYVEDDHYINLFKHFEKNLNESSLLIVVGYGFQDPGINEYLINNYLKKGNKMIVIDPYKPKTDILEKYNVDYMPHGVTEIPYNDYMKMITKE
jgi:hypothetical protein